MYKATFKVWKMGVDFRNYEDKTEQSEMCDLMVNRIMPVLQAEDTFTIKFLGKTRISFSEAFIIVLIF